MRGMGLGVAIGAGVGAVMASAYGSEYLAGGALSFFTHRIKQLLDNVQRGAPWT